MYPREVIDVSIRCRCGQTLLDTYDGRIATVGERSFPLSRRTDFLSCPACGSIERVVDHIPIPDHDEHPVAVLRDLAQEPWDA